MTSSVAHWPCSTDTRHGAGPSTVLARDVGASRSTLAERFAHYLHEPPMAYLARWRLQLGARLLATTQQSVLEVAGRVGYESEAAFNRAFRREYGLPPGRFRRAASTRASKHLGGYVIDRHGTVLGGWPSRGPHRGGRQNNVWLYDIERGLATRVTNGRYHEPLWTADGHLVMSKGPPGDMDIVRRGAEGDGAEDFMDE